MQKKNDKAALNFLKERLKDQDFRKHYFEEQFRKQLGAEIGKARKLKKMSEQELADAIGMPKATIVKLERGDVKRITTKTIIDVAAALGMKVSVGFSKPDLD